MRIASVGKRYGRGAWVLTDVSMDIDRGQVVAIGGANGGGKSTLLNILAGLTRPTAGRVSARPGRIGYVPERFPSTSRLSALTYLTHMGRIKGLSAAEARQSGNNLLERFHFAGQRNSELRTLSNGNAQKVALAQALMVQPELLILDEPWTGLDQVGHTVLTDIISETASRAGIVVLSTHPGVPSPVSDTLRFLLVSGSLAPAPTVDIARVATARVDDARITRAGTCRVMLRRNNGSDELPAAWSLLPSAPDGDDGSVVFLVDPADCDRFLLESLRRGWTVVAVVPAGDDSDTAL